MSADKYRILPNLDGYTTAYSWVVERDRRQAEYIAAHEHWYTTERAYRNWARRRRRGSTDDNFPSPAERVNAEERRDAARAALLKHMEEHP